MPDIWMDVDTALSEVPVNIMPLLDDTDFKTIEDAVAYNAAGMALFWHFVTSAGAYTVTAVTPTTAGVYDWTDQGTAGIYTIEIPASGGASINNDTEGYGWFTGKATGVLPWRGPTIGFRAAAINDSMCDTNTTGLVAPTVAGRTLDISAGGEAGVDWANVGTPGSTVGLTATTVATVTTTTTATNVTTVNGLAANVITAASIAADAITDAKVAADVTIASVTGAVGSVTGAVGSVTGAVGSVTAGVTVTTNNDKTGYGLSAAAVQAIWDALTAALTTVGSIGKKLADWTIGTAQTGDSFARLGAPAGASVSADIAAVKVDTAATLADTGTDGVVVAAGSKTGYSLTATTGLGNQTATITGNLSGSVGSVTAAVAITSNIKQNQALNGFTFLMTDSTNHAPATGLTVTVTRSIDGGAFAAGTLSAVSEVGAGVYSVNFGAGDLNGKVIILKATEAASDTTFERIVTQV